MQNIAVQEELGSVYHAIWCRISVIRPLLSARVPWRRQLSITIGFEGPDGTWQSTGSLPPLESMALKKINENPSTYYGRHDGRVFLHD